jgi:hypothetical protein
MLVQHNSLGQGKVVALEPDAVHVFFPGRGERFAAKLRLPGARAFLRIGSEDRNAWLEGLTSFTLDGTTGRWALPTRWMTLDQAVGQFLAAQPKGFSGTGAVTAGRTVIWRAAHQAFTDSLGGGEAERLLDAGELRECVKRVLKIAKLVSPLHGEEEHDALDDALGDDDATRRFLRALFELLSVPSPGRARFDKLFAAATGLTGAPGSRWLVVTLFPFIGRPDRHVLMRPGSTREAAERLGFDLRFDEAPNWATYAALRALSGRLLEALVPAGARDFIDVEAFTHAASTMRASGGKPKVRSAKAKAKLASAAAAALAAPIVSAKGAVAAKVLKAVGVKPAKSTSARATSRAAKVPRAKPAPARASPNRKRTAAAARRKR